MEKDFPLLTFKLARLFFRAALIGSQCPSIKMKKTTCDPRRKFSF